MSKATKSPVIEVKSVVSRSRHPPIYMGLTMLPGGKLIATDHSNHLCCELNLPDSCKVKSEFKLAFDDWGLARVSDTEVAVLMPWERSLQFVSVGASLSSNKTIVLERNNPVCAARLSDTELVVGWSEGGFGIVSMDGQERKYFDKDQSGRAIKFHFNGSILHDASRQRLYIHLGGKVDVIYCYDMAANTVFEYSHAELKKPRGMTLDNDGNLFICSQGTGSVHQVNPSGALVQMIKLDIGEPISICFDPQQRKFLVMNLDPATNSTTYAQQFMVN